MEPQPKLPSYFWIHRILAHPMHICWVIGTLTLWIPLTGRFHETGMFEGMMDDWTTIPLLVVGYAAASGLGFFLILIFLGWLVILGARRINGAPHQVGEQVAVLAGPYAGRISTIYEICQGQGGQSLPRVDLGEEARKNHHDLFDEYRLLRVSPR